MEMKKIIYLVPALILLIVQMGFSQAPEDTEDWSRKPEVVVPGKHQSPPGDAIVLFDGTDLSRWTTDAEEEQWKVFGKSMTVVPGTGSIRTKQSFGDVQLHLEWRAPRKIEGDGQERGNSGVYLMGLYEVQVLDSYDNETYYNGQAASVYKQYIPLVNVCRKPGKWQVYDIIFTAPRFNPDKTLAAPAYITVFHNGVLVQNHVELKGPTEYNGKPNYRFHKEKLPLMLQDHSNPVSYRNIWIREL